MKVETRVGSTAWFQLLKLKYDKLLHFQVLRYLRPCIKDTVLDADVSSIAVLRLDGDMYSSTIQVLEAFYPKVGWCKLIPLLRNRSSNRSSISSSNRSGNRYTNRSANRFANRFTNRSTNRSTKRSTTSTPC